MSTKLRVRTVFSSSLDDLGQDAVSLGLNFLIYKRDGPILSLRSPSSKILCLPQNVAPLYLSQSKCKTVSVPIHEFRATHIFCIWSPLPENTQRSLKLSHYLDSVSSSLSWFRTLVHCIDFSCFHPEPQNLPNLPIYYDWQ